ncbi:DNA polymerase [uncultured Vagococcus sp.]|uniref:DNA polymerase n=1 Tax=uncultured Vagococcus sp. TaxID=189676 RepID=UPI00258A0584|nr:DNA polymerase [uncultured Vagococcus sp.]
MTLLNLSLEEDKAAIERVKQAEITKKLKEYQPTWEEVFHTGYQIHTGRHKKGLFEMKNSEADTQKLKELMTAIQSNEIGSGVSDRKKFSKSHALNQYRLLLEQRKADIIKEYIANIPDNYHSIQTEEALHDMIQLAKQESENALDTETTGLHLEKDKVVGMSITLPKANQHYYIPFLHQNYNVGNQLEKSKVMKILQSELYDRKDLLTVMFNAKFDMHQLIKEGLQFKGTVVDALVGMKILNENELRYALKVLANKWGKYFGYTDNSMTFEELFSKNPEDFYIHADYRLCYFYACKDTHLTYLLYKFIEEQMKKQPKLGHVFFDIEVPITEISFKMEQNGMPMDLEYADSYKKQIEEEIAELDRKIKEFFGDINWNSPVQIQKKLYEDMKLKPVDDKKGTGADVLKILSKQVPELEWLLEYRGKTKLLGSFIEPIPQLVWSDGRVHGRFNSDGTKTGRFSSDLPNLQNIPYPARPMFKAEDGKLIIGIDFSWLM